MKPKKIPFRMCVGCQEMKSKKELLRVVRTPEGDIVLDPTGKKAGRGAYMCRSEACLTKAFKEKRLEKALKHPIGEDVYNALRAGIIE
ncbi:MAG: hypothetical protein H6Q72_1765 [Firmicutes bacterium]|nr:hypothetical protein [Bacillota bacterium]